MVRGARRGGFLMMARVTNVRKVPFAGKISALIEGDDRYYILKYQFGKMNDPKMTETLRRIRATGIINLDHWRIAGPNEKWV
jgi:hypothetical protein